MNDISKNLQKKFTRSAMVSAAVGFVLFYVVMYLNFKEHNDKWYEVALAIFSDTFFLGMFLLSVGIAAAPVYAVMNRSIIIGVAALSSIFAGAIGAPALIMAISLVTSKPDSMIMIVTAALLSLSGATAYVGWKTSKKGIEKLGEGAGKIIFLHNAILGGVSFTAVILLPFSGILDT